MERARLNFDASMTIALEAMLFIKGRTSFDPTVVEQQVAVRVMREGEEDKVGASWTLEDVRVEIDEPGKLVEDRRNASWRQWWNGPFKRTFL